MKKIDNKEFVRLRNVSVRISSTKRSRMSNPYEGVTPEEEVDFFLNVYRSEKSFILELIHNLGENQNETEWYLCDTVAEIPQILKNWGVVATPQLNKIPPAFKLEENKLSFPFSLVEKMGNYVSGDVYLTLSGGLEVRVQNLASLGFSSGEIQIKNYPEK